MAKNWPLESGQTLAQRQTLVHGQTKDHGQTLTHGQPLDRGQSISGGPLDNRWKLGPRRFYLPIPAGMSIEP